MILTLGRYWLLIIIAVLAIGGVWYWSALASHRVLERAGQQEQKRFGFSWRKPRRR
mgnify:CR=1 FL=1